MKHSWSTHMLSTLKKLKLLALLSLLITSMTVTDVFARGGDKKDGNQDAGPVRVEDADGGVVIDDGVADGTVGDNDVATTGTVGDNDVATTGTVGDNDVATTGTVGDNDVATAGTVGDNDVATTGTTADNDDLQRSKYKDPSELNITRGDSTYKEGFNTNSCDQLEKEILALQKDIQSNETFSKDGSLARLNQEHDAAMAELVILRGLKNMLDDHKQYVSKLRSATDGFSRYGDLEKMHTDLQKGVDATNRIIVFQDMVEDLIGSSDADIESFRTSMNSADVPKFKSHLKSKCESKSYAEYFNNRLCYVLAPMSPDEIHAKAKQSRMEKHVINLKEDKGIEMTLEEFRVKKPKKYEELMQEALKRAEADADVVKKDYAAKQIELEKNKASVDEMINGFGEAFVLSSTSTSGSDDAAKAKKAEERQEKLKKYRDLIARNVNIPGLYPDDLIEKGTSLEGALALARTGARKKGKSELAGNIASMQISKSVTDYKKCVNEITPFLMRGEKIPKQCSFSLDSNICPKEEGSSTCIHKDLLANARAAATKLLPLGKNDVNYDYEVARLILKQHSEDTNKRIAEGAGRLIDKLHGSNEKTSGATAPLQLSLEEAALKKMEAKGEKQIEKINESMKDTFHAFLSQMDTLDLRREMASSHQDKKKNELRQGIEEKERPKKFLKALKGAGCLKDSDIDGDFDETFNKVFGAPENFKIGYEKITDEKHLNHGVRHKLDKKSHNFKMNEDFIKECMAAITGDGSTDFNARVKQLEDTVTAKKEAIKQIKENPDYKAKDLISLLAITNYKDKCSSEKRDHGGAFNYNKCSIDYEKGHLKNNELEVLVSHTGRIISMVDFDEKRKLSTWRTELRKDTRLMKKVCEDDKFKELHGEICKKVETAARMAEVPTHSENIRQLHRDYHIYYDSAGKMVMEKKKSAGSMWAGAVGYGIVNHAMPFWAQYETNKAQMNYNEALGYNQKIYNYMMDNPQYWSGYGQVGGWGGYYPYGYFGGSFPVSPYMINYSNYNYMYYNM